MNHSPFGRVGLSGPERAFVLQLQRALPGRYRVSPSRKREGVTCFANSLNCNTSKAARPPCGRVKTCALGSCCALA